MSLSVVTGETVLLSASEIEAGDILLGDAGGHVIIEDIYPDPEHSAFICAETHIGVFHLDANADHKYPVVKEAQITPVTHVTGVVSA